LLEPDSGEHDDNVVFNLIDDCNDEAGIKLNKRVIPQNVLIISSLAVQKFWASIKSHPKIGNQ